MKQVAGIVLAFAVAASVLFGQTTDSLRQTFHAPKGDIEQALKDLNANQSGRLPFLEGFVGAIDAPLANYQRAYYQYTIDVKQTSETEVSVGVNARISAWYEDRDAAKSGYRDLPSNGRLEADLLDRLRSRLRKNFADAAASKSPVVSPRLLGIAPSTDSAAGSIPDAPATTAAPVPSFRGATPLASSTPPPASKPPDSTDDPRHQRLSHEEEILKGVLAAQQHPQDLIAIKAPHTRITAAPSDTAKVVMYADAEDEFQILKFDGDWVHVQISGLNRGWVHRSQIELLRSVQPSAAPEAKEISGFQQVREETGAFPGDWAALRGKNVKIIWVQPKGKSTQKARLSYTESVFKKQVPETATGNGVEGVVVVFDAAEGGMAATTLAALKQWGAGTISDAAFLKQCWFDPAEAFTAPANR